MQINHHRQVKPTFMGADIGNISDPSLIRGVMGKLTLQLIGLDQIPSTDPIYGRLYPQMKLGRKTFIKGATRFLLQVIPASLRS